MSATYTEATVSKQPISHIFKQSQVQTWLCYFCFCPELTMSNSPNIVLSHLDLARLEKLIERSDADLSALEGELARADVVDAAQVPANVITMNSTARFADEASGTEHQYTLVYPQDADISAGKVSILAPVGSALLGLTPGQAIDWPGPGGRQLRLRVLEVIQQPLA